MSATWRSILKQRNWKQLFEVRSAIQGVGRTTGFVVDFSDDLILFHVLETDSFRLNGYTAIRTGDIRDYRGFDRAEFWQHRAVRRLKILPVRPAGISLTSVPGLLTSISKRYPLITIHSERTNPGICYIGRLISMTEATFKIDNLDCNAEWSGPRRLKFSDVTRVDFGGGYEEALALTAPKRQKRKQCRRGGATNGIPVKCVVREKFIAMK